MNEYLETGLYVVGTCILIILGWYYWKGYYPGSSYIIEQPPVTKNGLEEGQAKFMFFYTSWCPWSHKAWPKWKSFKQLLENTSQKYGGHQIIFEEIDCEADKGKAALYKIAGYPTFKLCTTEQTYVFKGIPDSKTFDVFLQACLGEKSSS